MARGRGRADSGAAQLNLHLPALSGRMQSHRPLQQWGQQCPLLHRPHLIALESLPEPHRGSITWASTSRVDVRGGHMHGPGQDSAYLPPSPFPGEEAEAGGGEGISGSQSPVSSAAGSGLREAPGVPELVASPGTPLHVAWSAAHVPSQTCQGWVGG